MSPLQRSNDTAERVFSGIRAVGWQVGIHSYAWSPPTDVYETDASFIVRVEVAGMRQSDFNISVEENYLIITGVRVEEPERRAYQQMEIRFGEFNASVELPHGVDMTRPEANYEDGFLTIILPKVKPTNINITG